MAGINNGRATVDSAQIGFVNGKKRGVLFTAFRVFLFLSLVAIQTPSIR
jgi:hypothetical protein